MATLKPRTLFHIVSLFVMVVLMFSFVSTMANAYMDSMQCISTSIDYCESTPSDTGLFMVSNSTPGNDEWLCSTGEMKYCASNNGLTVALQTK